MPGQIFLSYSSEDQRAAAEICRLLELQGVDCWIAPRDVSPGEDYGVQIIDAIEAARAMVLVLSDHANSSTFVKNEIERAISKNKVVIPFRIENVQPSRALELFISRSQWIDAWTPPLEARIQVLATAIRGLLSLPEIDSPVRTDPKQGATRLPKRSLARPLALLGSGVLAVVLLGLVLAVAPWAGGHAEPSAHPTGWTIHAMVYAVTENGSAVTAVQAGDTISIQASGNWCMGTDVNGVPICGGPNGIREAQADEQPILDPGAPIGALVARVGGGNWLVVGTGCSWKAATSGELWLAFNERLASEWWADNLGSLSVDVVVAP